MLGLTVALPLYLLGAACPALPPESSAASVPRAWYSVRGAKRYLVRDVSTGYDDPRRPRALLCGALSQLPRLLVTVAHMAIEAPTTILVWNETHVLVAASAVTKATYVTITRASAPLT
jgi:hypothetical protein